MKRSVSSGVGILDERERGVVDIAEEGGVEAGSGCVEEGVCELEVEREVSLGVVRGFGRSWAFGCVLVWEEKGAR